MRVTCINSHWAVKIRLFTFLFAGAGTCWAQTPATLPAAPASLENSTLDLTTEINAGFGAENELLRIRAFPRTGEQMAAFYEARGLPTQALAKIKKACFVTVGIYNKSDHVIWLELHRWQVKNKKNKLPRLTRQYWQQQFAALGVPQSERSTFNWTLLPEERNLQPHEPVAGNIIIDAMAQDFTLLMSFRQGEDKRGANIKVKLDKLRCEHQ